MFTLLIKSNLQFKFILLVCSILYSQYASANLLESLIIESIQSHPSVLSTLESRETTLVEQQSARMQFYPTPSIGVNSIYASSDDSNYQGDDRSWNLSLSQPLYTGGRLTAGFRSAKIGVSMSELDVYEAQETIALRLVQAYGNWLSARLKTKAWRGSRAIHDRLKDQVERRVEVGLSPDSDLSLAISRLESTHAEIATLQAEQAVAVNNIREILGRDINAQDLTDDLSLLTKDIGKLDQLLQQVHLVSPSIQRAQYEVDQSEQNIHLQAANLRPNIELRLERQEGSLTTDDSGADNRIFLNVTSQLGAGLSTLNNIKAAKYARRAAMTRVTAQIRLVEQSVRSDYAQAISFRDRVRALTRSLASSRQVSESYERQFPVGRKSWLDVLNSVRDLVGNEVQLADAKAAQMVVTWRLAIIARGLSEVLSDYRDISEGYANE